MANTHSFNVSLASVLGLEDTLLLQHIYYWHQANKHNPSMIKDGRVWTYQPVKKMIDIFPYLTTAKIKSALKRLEDNGYIYTANYNKMAMDRTKWYSVSDKCLAIFDDHLLKSPTISENRQAIQEIESNKVDINKTISKDISKVEDKDFLSPPNGQEKTPQKVPKKSSPTLDEVREYCTERNNNVDAERFFDFYEANGWVQGGNKKIKDWRAAVRTWERREYNNNQQKNYGATTTRDNQPSVEEDTRIDYTKQRTFYD